MTGTPDGDSGFICIPRGLATLLVSGDDAETFLQGQLTNDITLLKDSCQLNAWCNPKGRVIALLKLWRSDAGIWMQFPHSLLTAVATRMRIYILRSHVVIEDRSEGIETVGLFGRVAEKWLKSELRNLPGRGLSVQHQGLWINSPHRSSCRYLVNGAATEMKKYFAGFPQEIPFYDGDSWTGLDIRDGIPEILADTSEQFIPQSINLDILGAISFSKGCYTGQEIVARTHYLGTPKQRMYRAHFDTSAGDMPAPGSKLFLPGGREQSIGRVVSCFEAGDVCELLVSVKVHARSGGACRVRSPDGPEIILGDPPYDINNGVASSG